MLLHNAVITTTKVSRTHIRISPEFSMNSKFICTDRNLQCSTIPVVHRLLAERMKGQGSFFLNFVPELLHHS